MASLVTHANPPLSRQGPMNDVFSQAPYYEGQQMPTNPGVINTSFTATQLEEPNPANSELISRDDEGHMTVTTMLDVERSKYSPHLADSQYAFLHRGQIPVNESRQDGPSPANGRKPITQRFGKMTVLTLPLANDLIRTMSAHRREANPVFWSTIQTIKAQYVKTAFGASNLTENELNQYQMPEDIIDNVISAEAGSPAAIAYGVADGAARRLLCYATAYGVLKTIAPMGGICTQPNKLHTADNTGPGNFSADGGNTSCVIGWRGNVDLRDVWGLDYTAQNPINHSRLLTFVLKRVYLSSVPYTNILDTHQREWSALCYVPVPIGYSRSSVEESHKQYLGYGGAVEFGRVVFVGTVMMQVDKRKFSQADRDLAAGLHTPLTGGMSGAPLLTNCCAKAAAMNLYTTTADPTHATYHVQVRS